MADSAFFTPLNHEALLAVRGPDAAKFLQGQLTCNLNYLDERTSSLGARCTPKGRMISSFRIVQEGDGYLLALASELLEAQLTDLKKYAVFSKSSLADESTAWARFGLSGGDGALVSLGLDLPQQADAVARANGLLALRLPGGRAELWAPAAQAESLQARLAAQLPEAPLNDWLLGQVRAGIGQVFGATRELFIPQMINLQAVGGVSFKKGCYPGQEIVARTQYLGKLKRRMYRASADCPPPAAGTPVHGVDTNGQACGVVVDAVALPDGGCDLLAVVQMSSTEAGEVRIGGLDGPVLRFTALPYALGE